MDFPVFCHGVIPQDSFGGWEIVGTGGSATIGGVPVEARGDYVVADADGIILVPQDILNDVLERAEPHRSEESLRADMISGIAPLEAFRRSRLA